MGKQGRFPSWSSPPYCLTGNLSIVVLDVFTFLFQTHSSIIFFSLKYGKINEMAKSYYFCLFMFVLISSQW